MFRFPIATTAAVLFASVGLVWANPVTAGTVATNLLTNGGFENGGLSPWAASGNVGPNSVAVRASEGSFSAAFSVGATPPDGEIQQTFATVPGQSYALKFDLGSFGSSQYYAKFGVTVEGASVLLDLQEDAPLAVDPNVTYRTARLQFTADSASTTLKLTDDTEDTERGAGAVDGYLDAFSVVAGQTISPSGQGTLGTVHYLGGNLALDDDEDPDTPNAAGLKPTATSSATNYGTSVSGGNDGEGKGQGFNAGWSWHAAPIVEEEDELWTVDLGTLPGSPNGDNQTYAIGSVEVFSRTENATLPGQSDGNIQVLDENDNPVTSLIGLDFAPQTHQVADFEPGSVFGRTIRYTDMRSFNELEVHGIADLDFNVASTMLLDIDATGHDFVHVEGDAVLAGTIMPVLPGSAGAGVGDWFDVLTASSIELAETLAIDGSMTDAGGAHWEALLIDHGGSQTLRLSLVPEPGACCLLLLGVATLLLCRRRG